MISLIFICLKEKPKCILWLAGPSFISFALRVFHEFYNTLDNLTVYRMPTEAHFKSSCQPILVILVGDCRVGKTSYLNFITKNSTVSKGQSQPPTIGVEYAPAKVKVRGQDVKINLWDTCTYHLYGSRGRKIQINYIVVLQKMPGGGSYVRPHGFLILSQLGRLVSVDGED